MKRLISAALLGTALHGAMAADQALLEAARTQQAPLLATLKDLVLIESGSSDSAGLARVADYSAARLKALGAAVERKDGIVTGRFSGKGRKKLMLIAHMDTVYQPGILATQPYRVDGNRIYGPGIADDKSGVALILHTIEMLHARGWHDYAQLTVIFNPDEEIGSPASGEWIASQAALHDFVFSCEPNGVQAEGLLLSASGIATARMTVEGRAAHAGVAPKSGRNALVELSHQVLQTQDINVPGAQLNWTRANAGLATNQIPASATVQGDVRLSATDGAERLLQALNQKVATPLVPDTVTKVEIQPGRPPFIATDAARTWAAKAQAIYGEIGRKLALYPATGGGTDAGYASRSGKAIVLEAFGLAGDGMHAKDEYITIDSVVPRLYLLSRMMQEAGASQ
ncbi:glutamate carboxypeptidase [Pseudoduganella umbonata]|uniref:Glutamate carboxypeptidase n=1 Tax=Pseudoduganella umbonata TaxID=864828 RepID=A0A4P8HWX4_9BURK|nr:glutamate carboxypeptidase [Pseudoduganella umbonata]MBB3223049.1 glutamate carboxypeptidase [Pseudoduganella umbonata]QCP13150.1 M20/M25/M40 family metallo-hydrolase [Pseudoduganella umbonata]